MVDWGFLFFSIIMGICMVPLGLFYLENGIMDSKFPTDFQFAFLNSYMPYFAYLVSALFIGGYIAILKFFYNEEHKCVKPLSNSDNQ